MHSLEQMLGAVVADSRRRTYALFGRFQCGVWLMVARQTRCAPLPLVGRGWGWGYFREGRVVRHRITPLPTPPPQGGREQTECAARLGAHKALPFDNGDATRYRPAKPGAEH